MASSDDLQNFIENLLTAFDPTIDLSPGSPAETQIVQPILDRFSDDPFSVDIPTFLRDRLLQEFPQLMADNGGQLEDLLTDPLQLFLEPFKREIESVKINQSVKNANLMSDDEADALGANFFENREAGGFSGGPVRIYFAAPVTVNITTDKRTYTNGGLNFFPVENFKISTAQMLFNRQGNLYYMDITVQAEAAGDAYNVAANDIANIDDVPGVVKVANLSAFTDGSPREDNETYLGRIPNALTERSLVTERGIEARIPELFSSVRALSIIGAGDPGMDRDILQGTSEGFLHIAGSAAYYGNWIIVSNLIYRDVGSAGDVVIQAGDLVRFKPASSTTVYEAHVTTVVPATTLSGSTEYILIIDTQFAITSPTSGSFALFKSGFITISEIPGGISSNVQVPDDTVHLGGHTDVFVRPNSDTTIQDSLPNITDDSPVLALAGDASTNLHVTASTGSPSNVAICSGINFASLGVQAGDLIIFETTALAGSYRILKVGDPDIHSLRLDTLFTQNATEIRARIVRDIKIDLVEPKVPKLPFDTGSVSDLSTTVGSTLFRLQTVNIQSFGAVVGDIIRILDGADAGDFTIVDFDNVLGGQGPIVNRAAAASTANLRYEVFTASTGLTLPLVRIKTIEILDSTNQGTGITIPYGDAVDVRPTCDLQGAGNEVRVLDSQIFIIPDGTGTLGGLSNTSVSPGAGKDSRYSQDIESYDGIYRAISTQDGGNPITQNEINLPPFLYNGVRNKLLAFTTRKDPNFTAFPSGDNRTSDVAESKIGDSLTILDGPNQGSYIITDLRVLDMWSVTDAGHQKIALVEVDPPLPTDSVKTMMDLVATVTPGSAFTGVEVFKIFQYATDFFNVSGFWALLQTRLQAVMTALSITISNGDLNNLTSSLSFTGYAVGPSAKGTLRCYFQDPVSVEFSSGANPTRFNDLVQVNRLFRIDPNLPDAQILPESETQNSPSNWNRNVSMPWYANGSSSTDFAFESSGAAFVKRGITDGDILDFYASINDFPARDQMQSSWVCLTQAGSNVITMILPQQPGHLTPIEAGQLFFIDSGPDIGAYTITEVITDQLSGGASNPDRPVVTFRIDKTMTHSTLDLPGDAATTARPAMPDDFTPGTAQTVSSESRLIHSNMANVVPNTDWVTIYAVANDTVNEFGDDAAYLGTFAVVDADTDGIGSYWAVLDRTPAFPDTSTTPINAYPASANVFWIIHSAPTSSPAATSGGGTVISDQYVRCRLYDSVPQSRVISIPWASGNPLVDHVADLDPSGSSYGLDVKQIEVLDTSNNPKPLDDSSMFRSSAWSFYAHLAPFRIRRPGVHRTSSTAMALQKEGALYFIDVPVIGYGPQAEMNISESAALGIKENAVIDGYSFEVDNTIFTFSDQEQVSIVLPAAILPVGSTPGLSNEINLSGQTISVTYDNAPLAEELQRFFNSPLDRVVVANYLLRHFLPAYVYLDASYVGGSDTSVVATDLIDLVNNIPPSTNQLVASDVEKTISNRGATKVTLPITLIALVHDIDRKIRGLRSQDAIGAGDIPVFNGTYAQTYFIAGPDTSTTTPRPSGEQVFLTKS